MRYDFRFTSLSLIAPPKVRFKYRLNGIDDDWVDAGNLREAIYTNLPKGKYSFEVIASNNDGIWNETPRQIKIFIKTPWWRTWWFYTACVLIIGGIVVLIKHLNDKTKQIQKPDTSDVLDDQDDLDSLDN